MALHETHTPIVRTAIASTSRELAGMEASWAARSISDAAGVADAGHKMATHIVAEAGSTEPGRDQLISTLRSSRNQLADTARFVHAVNALPAPDHERDITIGQTLLPLVIWNFAHHADSLTGNDAKLYQQYVRTHTDPETSSVQFSIPSWLLGLQDVLSISVNTKALPDERPYLAASPTLSDHFHGIAGRILGAQKELSDAIELNDKTNAGVAHLNMSPPDTYAPRVAKFRAELHRIQAEVPALFETLTDVEPKDVPEVMQSIGAAVSLNRPYLAACIGYCRDLEQLLISAMTPEEAESKGPHTIHIPRLMADSTIQTQNAEVPPAQLQNLAGDGELLVQLVQTYIAARALLRSMLPTLKPFPELEAVPAQMYDILSMPFSHDRRGVAALEGLLKLQDPACKDAVLALLSEKITGNGTKPEEWAHCLDDQRTFRPLAWTIKNYLGHPNADNENAYLLLLKDSGELRTSQVAFLQQVKSALRANDVELLSRTLSQEIRDCARSDSVFRLLAPLIAIDVLVSDSALCSQLRSQVTEVTSLLDLGTTVQRLMPSFAPHAATMAAMAVKSLAVSMVDYFRDPEMVELWEAVERYKVLIRHPEATRGLPGDKLMESGLALIGPFGAGKTFLVECIANELGVKKEELSAEDALGSKEVGGREVLNRCRTSVENVEERAKRGEAFIWFIDEAEGVVFNRDNPHCDSGQYQVTDYMLSAIGRTRVNYPRVLIIIATNHPDKIDPGIMRPGRIDIPVNMFQPGPKVREGMIRGTLAEQKIALNLSPEQIADLVKITEGMMPLSVTRPIVELNVIDRLMAQDAGHPFVIDFTVLKERYEKKARDHARRMGNMKKAAALWQREAEKDKVGAQTGL